MEGILAFKKGSLRFRKAEMKKFYFVLTHNPTNAEFRYVLTWFKDDTKIKLKGCLNISRSLEIAPEEHKQLFLGYYFQIRNSEDGESYHFSVDTKEVLEKWVSKFREATLTDVYSGVTKANKFREQTVVNIYLSNNCIAFVHPISEETLLSWKLSQIVSFVFDQTDFSFVICSKCSKVAGRFTQEVTLQTAILIIGTMEDRISQIYANYPGSVITHEKNISGDVYRVPHVCRRVLENTYESPTQSCIRFQHIPNSPTANYPFTFPANRTARSNTLPIKQDLCIRSLSNSPINTFKHSPLSPGRNLVLDATRMNSLPMTTQRRFNQNSVQRVPLAQAHTNKNSLDSWHSNSCSHTMNIRNSCLSEIKWPQSYQPKNRMLAASLENLDIKTNIITQKPQNPNSKWPVPSSGETSDYSEGISQSNYSPSLYPSSGRQSYDSFSPPPSVATGQECWKKGHERTTIGYSTEDAIRGNSLPRNGRVCPPETELSPNHRLMKSVPDNSQVFPFSVARNTSLLPLRDSIPLGKTHYQMPRVDRLVERISPDSEHVYSIPNIHSRSMELLNKGANEGINSSSNTSSSDYYEPMKSSVGVRHKPKHINTVRGRVVRKSKRENQSSDSSSYSFTSESSGNTSVSTDDGLRDNKRTHL